MQSQPPSTEMLTPTEQSITRWNDSPWRTVIGVLLMIGAEAAWFAWKDQPVPGLLLALAASLLLLRAPGLEASVPPETTADTPDSRPPDERRTRLRYLWLVPGIGLSLVVAERAMQNSPGKVWWLLLAWAVSGLLTCLAFVSLSAIRNWIHHVRDSFRRDRREWLFVLVLMIAAFGIRVIALRGFPAYMLEDEGFFAAQAAELHTVFDWEYSPFRYDTRFHPLMYHSVQAVSIKFLGQTLEAARLPSALIGVLAVPGLYLAARRMFNPRVAVAASLFLVAFPQHIYFSDLALNQPMDPTLTIWTFAFLARALDQQDKIEYGLAGLTLGLSQYGFSSARLIPLLVVGYIGLYLLSRRITFRSVGPGLVVITLVSLVLVWPQIRFLIGTGASLMPRVGNISIWQPTIHRWFIAGQRSDQLLGYWVNQISRPFLAFVQLRDAGPFYGSFDPYLGWLAPVPFLLGLIHTIRRRKDPNHAILLVWWISVVVLGGIAVANPPEYQRFMIATPVLAILVGVGVIFFGDVLSWLSRTLTPDQAVSWRADYWGTPVVLVVLIAVFNLTTYLFGYRVANVNSSNPLTIFWNELVTDVLPSLTGYKIWFLSGAPAYVHIADTGILRYLSPHTTRVEYTGAPEQLPIILAASGGKQAVIIVVGYAHVNEVIKVLDHVPTLTRRLVLYNPQHDFQLAYIYESAPG